MTNNEVIYQYDESFDGFLCCVYESYVNKELPIAFCGDEEYSSLYPIRYVITDRAHAKRVLSGVEKRSSDAAGILRRAFLTCMEDKEARLYAFVRKLFAQGDGFLKNLSDQVYCPISTAIRHMSREAEKLRGFVRFSDYDGILGAEIDPKNRVLPLLRPHFCSRYANEVFFIYDRTHRDLLLYASGHSRIMRVDRLHLNLPGEEELQYRALWKRFYQTIAIQGRLNPRCQNSNLPKRYRGTMTEFLPDSHEARANLPAAPADAPAPAVPGEILALGTHR